MDINEFLQFAPKDSFNYITSVEWVRISEINN